MNLVRRSILLTLVAALVSVLPAGADPALAGLQTGSDAPAVRAVVPRSRSPLLTAGKADPLAGVAQLKLGALDRYGLMAEDGSQKRDPQPYRFAIGREVALTPEEGGTWTQLADGIALWRLRVTASEATSLFFEFDRFFLPPSAELLIYAVDEESWIRPLKASDNNAERQLWTPLLETGDVVLELKVAEAERARVELSLAKVYQGYRGPGAERFDDGGPLTKSGACNVDVACPDGAAWGDQIRSVARYTFVKNGQGFLCSGALVNNTAGNFKPYFLTANHCVSTAQLAATVTAYFNYQNSTCRAPNSGASGGNGNGQLNQFISGASLRAHWGPSDFALLELNGSPQMSWNPYWAGWSRSSANPMSGVGIHHPQGDEKRISFENDPLSTTDYIPDPVGNAFFLQVSDWDKGTTEGGSSGSPLFDQNKRIVGALTGGFAACGNNQPDWYGRFSVSWSGGGASASRLSDWLDPTSSGNSVLNGTSQTAGPATPAAPTNLTATPISTTQINLEWQDKSNNETAFAVESRPFGGTFVEIGTVPANSTGAQVVNLSQGTFYDFRVRARNSAGNSAYSNIAGASTFAPTGPCVPGTNTLCLLDDRFRVETTWRTPQGATGLGTGVELTPDTGYFWFFNANNVEMVVKVLDACNPPFNRFWVFAGGLTNVEVRLTVTDTDSGAVQVYTNPLRTPFQPIQDTEAFATCP
jgi:hypothetical protein